MTVFVDTPMWPAHGRLWAHLVSDTSLDELHAFASAAGLPRRGFDLDHYDVPEDRVDSLVRQGAQRVSSHELTRRLIASGLRIRARDRTSRRSGQNADTPSPARAGDGVSENPPERRKVVVSRRRR